MLFIFFKTTYDDVCLPPIKVMEISISVIIETPPPPQQDLSSMGGCLKSRFRVSGQPVTIAADR